MCSRRAWTVRLLPRSIRRSGRTARTNSRSRAQRAHTRSPEQGGARGRVARGSGDPRGRRAANAVVGLGLRATTPVTGDSAGGIRVDCGPAGGGRDLRRVAYSVARRIKEFGLRMALGADTADIRRVVFQHAMAPILTGLGLGIVAGIGVAKGMSALLFHVSTLNPLAYLAAFLVLGIAGALPCWMTAGRAARTD